MHVEVGWYRLHGNIYVERYWYSSQLREGFGIRSPSLLVVGEVCLLWKNDWWITSKHMFMSTIEECFLSGEPILTTSNSWLFCSGVAVLGGNAKDIDQHCAKCHFCVFSRWSVGNPQILRITSHGNSPFWSELTAAELALKHAMETWDVTMFLGDFYSHDLY